MPVYAASFIGCFSRCLSGHCRGPYQAVVTHDHANATRPVFDSERPTSQAPYRAALAAQLAAEQRKREQEEKAKDKAKERAKPDSEGTPGFEESEAPTGVEVERPLFPKPPRMPRV